jgi:hypothetical protein
MNYKKLLNLTFIAIMLLNVNSSFGQAELKSEGVEGAAFPPTGWAGIGTINLWSRRTGAQTNPTCNPHGGTGTMRFASRNSFAAGTQQTISSPLMDLSSRGSGNSYFSFYIYRDTVFNQADSLTIFINTSRSLTGAKRLGVVARYAKLNLPDIVSEGWQQYSFSIPASYTGTTNYILIQGTARSGSGAGGNIFLDDFEWQHFPTYCSGTPTSGSITSNPTKICAAFGQATFTIAGNTTSYGTSIQWQSATTATGTYNNFGTGTNPATGNLTGTRFIRAIITCSQSGESDTTPYIEVKTNAGIAPTLTLTPTFGSICPGGNPVTLTAAASGNSTITWAPTTGLDKSTGDTVKANPTANTGYTVTATDTAGCTTQRNVNVFISANPVINLTFKDSSMCAGDSMLVTAAAGGGGGGGGNTYSWSTGSATANTYVRASGKTTATVTVKNGAGCTGTKSQNFYEVSKVKANFSYVQNGFSFDFKNLTTGGKAFHWFFGDGNESFKEMPTYKYSTAGPVEVIFIVENAPCGSDTLKQFINPQPLSSSTRQYLVEGVMVYPNPANNAFTVFVPAVHGSAVVNVRNLQGQLVNSSKITSNNSRQTKINTESLATGVYFVEVIANNKKDTYKIQVNH